MDILTDDLALSPRPQAKNIFAVSQYRSRALPASTTHPGGASIGIQAPKNRRYAGLCSAIQMTFHHLRLDTHVGLGTLAQSVVSLRTSSLARRLGTNSYSEYVRLLTTLSSFTIQLMAYAVGRRSLFPTTSLQ